MQFDHDASPFNAVPPAILLLAAAILVPELVFLAAQNGLIGDYRGGGDLRQFALQKYAFSGDIFSLMVQRGEFPPNQLMRIVTYGFVHGSFTHMAFAGVFTLALGKMVAEVFGQVQALALFLAGLVCGALAYWLALDDPFPLFGAFPGAYALIGGYTYILWVHLGHLGESQYRAFGLIAALLLIQLVFAMLFGGTNDWVADIGGFLAGLFLSVPLSPGGWRRLRNRLRQR